MPYKRRIRKHRKIDIGLPGSSNDTSGPLFSLYSKMLERDDMIGSERFQKDAENIFLFTGLFSATLAALITVTIQDLRPGPQDTLPFSPPTYSIWVNSLWISSLVITITSALFANLIQQWTRRYIRITQPALVGAAHTRARIRHQILTGFSNLQFLLATDAVPALLHLSVFLFFAGLLILLRHLNHTVFNAVVGWVLLCGVIYAHITFLPIYQPANPHYGPFSSIAWRFYTGIIYPGFNFLRGTRILDVLPPPPRLLDRLKEKVNEIVLEKSPKLDANILVTLLETIGEDDSREKFFEAIPGFYDSQVVHALEVKENFPPLFFTEFRRTVVQFLDQTLSSDSVSKIAKCHRLLTCLNATHRVLGERACRSITNKIIHSDIWIEMPPSPEIGHFLRRWSEDDSSIAHIGSCIIARILCNVEKRGETWIALAKSHLGVSEEVFIDYWENGDSVLLANLIKTMRLFLDKDMQLQGILQSISKFNVQDTCSELQQDFCIVWNQIVLKSKDSGDCIFVLDEIGHVYKALHPTPTSPVTVPVLPTPIAANNDSVLPGPSYALCADPQHNHHPPNASQQVTTVAASSSSSPPGVQPPSPPLQRGETNIIPQFELDTRSFHDPLSPPREFPDEIPTRVRPGLGHSYFTTTSHTLATLRDVSVSDPDVIVVASEGDFQDLNAHSPHQPDPDPHAPVNSMGTSGRGKSSV